MPVVDDSGQTATSGDDREAATASGRVVRACSNCKKAKARCDQQRPCIRCVRTGKQDMCVDSVHAKRGRKQQARPESPTGIVAGEAHRTKMSHSTLMLPEMALHAMPFTTMQPPLVLQHAQQQQNMMQHQIMQMPPSAVSMQPVAPPTQQLLDVQQFQHQQHQQQHQQQQHQLLLVHQTGLAAGQQQQQQQYHSAFTPLNVTTPQPGMSPPWRWIQQQQQSSAQPGLSMLPPLPITLQQYSSPSIATNTPMAQFAFQSQHVSNQSQLLSSPALFSSFSNAPRGTMSSPSASGQTLLQNSTPINRVLSSPAAVYHTYIQQQQQPPSSVSPPSTLGGSLYTTAASQTQQPLLSPIPLSFNLPSLQSPHGSQLPSFLTQLAPLPAGVTQSSAGGAAQSNQPNSSVQQLSLPNIGTVTVLQPPQQSQLQQQAQFPPAHQHSIYNPPSATLPSTSPFRPTPPPS